MAPSPIRHAEGRILLFTEVAKDASLTCDILRKAGIDCHECNDMRDLVSELDKGASAILVPEELVQGSGQELLRSWLQSQPPWSDLPVLVMALPGADSAIVGNAMDLLGNVTVLERPMRISALVSVVRTAVRARERQYQIRDHLKAREAAEAKLRRDDQRKDEFLAILAHELRNPLAPIRHALDVLGMANRLDPESERLRSLIERQVDHMVRLVDDLLEVSRITRGKVELRRTLIDAREIVQGGVEASRPLIDHRGHQLRVSLPTEPMAIDGDPVRLTQVVSNLLNNAAKYTDPGGAISIELIPKTQSLDIVITDNGIGISSEMLPRVFDLFVQNERSEERSHGGLGIGLTLVKSLVEMHGGSIEAYSEGLQGGSRFVVTLPRANDSLPQTAVVEHSKVPAIGRRVLVVDDNRDAANTLSALLGLLGADVMTVYGGEDALNVVRDFKPGIVLLDIGMPLLDGHEVAKRIRAMPEMDQLTLVALTGWGQEGDRRLSKEAGFDHHLVKPVDLRVLEGLLGALRTQRSK